MTTERKSFVDYLIEEIPKDIAKCKEQWQVDTLLALKEQLEKLKEGKS